MSYLSYSLVYIFLIIIGIFIGQVSKNPHKIAGRLIIEENDEKVKWILDMDQEPEDIIKEKTIYFKVCYRRIGEIEAP